MVRGAVIGVVVLATLTGVASAAPALEPLRAVAETASNFDDDAGGNADADDPAIWVHPTSPADSIVVGTLKNGGLTVVDLRGRELQHVPTPPDGHYTKETESKPRTDQPAADLRFADKATFGRIGIYQRSNNVDITGNLAVVSDRGLDRIRIYAIDPRGARAGTVLRDVTTAAPPLVFSAHESEVEDQRTAYGLATWADRGTPFVVVSRRHETRLGLFQLTVSSTGVGYRPAAFVDLPDTVDGWTPCAEPGEGPQVEGMVVDRVDNVLYAAQEDVGIWRIPLSRKGFGKATLIERVRSFGQQATYDPETEECAPTGPPSPAAGTHLTADAEGLTIAYGRHDRTLLASSQGDSTFARYRIDGGFRYTGGFEVVDGPATDGVQHSDGAAVTTTPLGPLFPHGLLVLHDGENTPATESRTDTNFKILDARLARVG